MDNIIQMVDYVIVLELIKNKLEYNQKEINSVTFSDSRWFQKVSFMDTVVPWKKQI